MNQHKSVSALINELKLNSEGVKDTVNGDKLDKDTLPQIKVNKEKGTEPELELPKLAVEHKLTRFTHQVIPNSKDILCK